MAQLARAFPGTLWLLLFSRCSFVSSFGLAAQRVGGAASRVPSPLRVAADAVQLSELDFFGRQKREVSSSSEYQAKGSETDILADGEGSSEPVVKVYTVHSALSPQMPWTAKAQEESTGSGFSIEHNGERCILTNAHVVSDATYVEVRKAGDARKYVATRRKVSHECDLATLTVEDPAFWRETTPLAFGAVPCLQDEVSVVGYPEGGEGVSVTVGVVSRIEIQR
jgi:S1-C subfamily serine protease